jgi:hypothetical protein
MAWPMLRRLAHATGIHFRGRAEAADAIVQYLRDGGALVTTPMVSEEPTPVAPRGSAKIIPFPKARVVRMPERAPQARQENEVCLPI